MGRFVAGAIDEVPGGAGCNQGVLPEVIPLGKPAVRREGATASAEETAEPSLGTGDAQSSFVGEGFAGSVLS